MIKPEDLTDALLAGYFGEHCKCRPLDIERLNHFDNCDIDPCEDVRAARGSGGEAQAAKRRICEDLIAKGDDPAELSSLGKRLLTKRRIYDDSVI